MQHNHSTDIKSAANDQMWMQLVIQLRPELRIDFRNDESNVVIVEDPVRGRFYQIGADEFQLIASLDGVRTVQQAVEHANTVQNVIQFESEDARSICDFLLQSCLARYDGPQHAERIERAVKQNRNSKWMNWINPVCLKVNLFNPDPLLKRITPMTKWFFGWGMFVIWMVTALYALMICVSKWDQLVLQSQGILSTDSWYWLIVCWVVLKAIHESAHGIACRKYGGQVRRGGICFILFAPLAFVDVTSAWNFTQRSKRIIVSCAGMYAELFIAFLAVIVWSHVGTGVVSEICYRLVLMASVTTVLFNANPLMRFDGYFVLSDLLKIPNLYQKGQSFLSNKFKAICLGINSPEHWEPKEARIVAVYGVMTLVWRTLLCVSILIGASILWNGLGLILAVIAATLWWGVPAIRFVKSIWIQSRTRSLSPVRMGMATICFSIAILASIFWLKSPTSLTAPAIVTMADEKIVRSTVAGFVDSIHVNDGDFVLCNQVVLRLHNDQLDREINRLQTLLAQSVIQSRIYNRNSDLARYQSEQELRDSLETQLSEKLIERDKLVIRAPMSGHIHRRGLDNLAGSYLDKGDVVFAVCNQTDTEISVSISQDDLESIDDSVGKNVKLIFPGMKAFNGIIKDVSPRATDQPEHASLCAYAGGPLPVKLAASSSGQKADSPDYRLLTPRFTATVTVEQPADFQLRAGQRGCAVVSAHQTSLADYLYLKTKRWLTSQIDR